MTLHQQTTTAWDDAWLTGRTQTRYVPAWAAGGDPVAEPIHDTVEDVDIVEDPDETPAPKNDPVPEGDAA